MPDVRLHHATEDREECLWCHVGAIRSKQNSNTRNQSQRKSVKTEIIDG